MSWSCLLTKSTLHLSIPRCGSSWSGLFTNYFAHSEATKSAKHVEMHLKDQLEEVEMAKEKLESELRR